MGRHKPEVIKRGYDNAMKVADVTEKIDALTESLYMLAKVHTKVLHQLMQGTANEDAETLHEIALEQFGEMWGNFHKAWASGESDWAK